MTVVRERDVAYNLLETGRTGEQTPQIRYERAEQRLSPTDTIASSETSFGLLRYYQPKERIVPFYKNRYYQLLWGKRKAAVSVEQIRLSNSIDSMG